MRHHADKSVCPMRMNNGRWRSSCRMGIIILLLMMIARTGTAADRFLYRPGIRYVPGRHQPTQTQLNSLLVSLQRKTGLSTLRFDDAGFLVCDDRARISGGSDSARRLLFMTLDGDKVIRLENYSHDQNVFFASIGNQQIFRDMVTGERIEALSLRMDFYDFGLLQGDRQALASFDTGMVVLHELGHAILELKDAGTSSDGPGACIGYTNRIRSELNYPLRQSYQPEVRGKATYDQGYQVELTFSASTEVNGRTRTKRYRIFWNSYRIGVLDCGRFQSCLRPTWYIRHGSQSSLIKVVCHLPQRHFTKHTPERPTAGNHKSRQRFARLIEPETYEFVIKPPFGSKVI